MNPIVLYPKNVADVKFFHDIAEKRGVGMAQISKEVLDEIDDALFAQLLIERRKNFKSVSKEEYEKLIARKLAE